MPKPVQRRRRVGEVMRAHPWVSFASLVSGATLLATVLGGWLWVENFFVTNDSFHRQIRLTEVQFLWVRLSTLNTKRKIVADKLYDLGVKNQMEPKGLSNWERFIQDRYAKELVELDSDIAQVKQQIASKPGP